MINKILRIIERNKKVLIILTCLMCVIYYLFIRDPQLETLKPPTFSINNNEIYNETEIYLSSEDEADIYYEIVNIKDKENKNVEVNLLSNKFDSDNPIKLELNTEVEIIAFAYKKGYNDSKIVKQQYKVQKKEPKPNIKLYNENIVAISGNFGANLYYTTDGSIPDPKSDNTKKYQGRFEINKSTTIKAIATRKNNFSSEISIKNIKIEDKIEEENKYYIFNKKINGKGKIIDNESNLGDTLKIEAAAAEGWEFIGWSGDISGNERTKYINVINNNNDDEVKNIVAEFREIKNHYDVKTHIIGEGEIVKEQLGDNLKIKVNPADGWEFIGWSGDVSGREYEKTINILSNKKKPGTINIIAEFRKIELINELEIDQNIEPLKIIKDKENKIVLSQVDRKIILYFIKQNKDIRWKIENDIIKKKEISLNKDMKIVDFIVANNEYIILCNYNKTPYLININKENMEYQANKIKLPNTEIKKIKKYKNNYIVGGTFYNNNERKISISVVNNKGNVLWNRLIYNENNNIPFESFKDLIVNNNNIFAIGNTINSINNDIFLVKLESKNNIDKYSFGSRNNDLGININYINDKLIIAAESNNIYPENKSDHKGYNILLEKRDQKNNLIKRKIIGGIDDFYPIDIKINNNNIYILGNNGTSNNIIIVKLDKNLSHEKIKTLEGLEAISMIINNTNIDILTQKENITKIINIKKEVF